MSRAVFLDRDGTLIKDKNYLDTPEGVEFFDGAFEALRKLSEDGFRLVLITNQSGVARGYMTEEDVRAIHDRVEADLEDEGISLDAIYYCPYLKEGDVEEYAKDSPLRKPSPGMLLEARDDLDIDLESSYVLGDKASDVEAGNRVDCATVLLRTGKGADAEQEYGPGDDRPDYVADTLMEAADWIVNKQTFFEGP